MATWLRTFSISYPGPTSTPPKVKLHVDHGHPLQYLFLGLANSGPGQGGAMIMDTTGELIWFAPDTGPYQSKMDFQRQVYHGSPVLTWFQGRVVAGGYGEGVAKIADDSYQVTHTIQAHNGLQVDEHEFNITPQGTALVSAFHKQRYDLSRLGGPKTRLAALRGGPGDRHRHRRTAVRVGQPGPRGLR